MAIKVLVPIANGFEEIEAFTIIDILRRTGATVTLASVQEITVTASHGIKVIADVLITMCIEETYDLVVLPGGMPGATHLSRSKALKKILLNQVKRNGYVGAICASPAVVLQKHNLLSQKKATCYPSFSDQLDQHIDQKVVVNQRIITSQGPGTAIEFSLKLVELLFGVKKVILLKKELLID